MAVVMIRRAMRGLLQRDAEQRGRADVGTMLDRKALGLRLPCKFGFFALGREQIGKNCCETRDCPAKRKYFRWQPYFYWQRSGRVVALLPP